MYRGLLRPINYSSILHLLRHFRERAGLDSIIENCLEFEKEICLQTRLCSGFISAYTNINKQYHPRDPNYTLHAVDSDLASVGSLYNIPTN